MNDSFARELARFGPDSRHPPVGLAQAQAYCRALTHAHYENFTVASLLLPRHLAKHFHAVYAYCRWADDLADETGGGHRALGLLRWWRDQLLDCYAGRASHPVMVALGGTVQRFAIPREPFLDLLYAFEQDQLVKRYQTYEQLLGYCRYSANPVGRLVLYLCECYNDMNSCLADRICTALQLANFWQDVARDYDIGRVYLPAEERERFGYTSAMLAAQQFTPEFAALLRSLVERTRAMFQHGLPLVERVRADVQFDIDLFIRGGLATLRKIERQGYNVWHSRPSLAKWEKAVLVGRAVGRRLLATSRQRGPRTVRSAWGKP
jgi:squalene synthase HpnC